MVVRIGEVSHEAPSAAPAGTGAPVMQPEASPAAQQAQIVTALAREAARRERLWAD